MKNRSSLLSAFLLAVPLVTGAGLAMAQTVTIKFSHFLAPNSNFHTGVAQPWCSAIEKDSGGKLKCQLYPAMQLGGTPSQLADQVKNGVADVVWTSPSFSTGRFPKTEALELPFILPPGGLQGARAMWEYVQKNAQDDYNDYKVLAIFSSTNIVISTANTPVLELNGFKGLKLRGPTHFSALFLKALGSTPITMPVSQVTEGISKGVIDGVIAPWEVLPSTKIDEVTKYHMEGGPSQPGLSQTPMAVLMNKKKYEGLPPELKAVIDKHSGLAMSEMAGKAWDAGNEAAKKKMAAEGHRILVIKDADYDALKKATASVEADWIKQANAKGLDGDKLVADVRAFGKKYMTAK